MSHFTVMVFGDNPEEQLAPFCDSLDSILELEEKRYNERRQGDPNASLQPVLMARIDNTEELRQEWENEKKTEKGSTDTFEEFVDEYYFGELKWIPKMVHEAYPEIETREVTKFPDMGRGATMGDPFQWWKWQLKFGHRFGVIGLDGKVDKVIIYQTPSPRWDWYVLGGRWKDFFKLKPEQTVEMTPTQATQQAYEQTLIGMLEKRFNISNLPEKSNKPGYADSAFKHQIDFAGMREDMYQQGLKLWDDFQVLTEGKPFRTYDEILAQCNGDHKAAREAQDADPIDSQIRKSDFLWYDVAELKEFRKPREEFARRHALRAYMPYAFIKDGHWYERGEMGWFGTSNDKFDFCEWARIVDDHINALPDDTRLSLYDCHI